MFVAYKGGGWWWRFFLLLTSCDQFEDESVHHAVHATSLAARRGEIGNNKVRLGSKHTQDCRTLEWREARQFPSAAPSEARRIFNEARANQTKRAKRIRIEWGWFSSGSYARLPQGSLASFTHLDT